jgi:glycosyltransferase involved in cell wall biosynthesis
MWILEGLAYRSSSACIGLAPGIVEGISRRSAKGHPIALIPNGCDLELFHPGLRGHIDIPGIAPGDFVAGFTGAHGRANGLDSILDAAAVLKRRGIGNIKILLVGDGSEKPRLQDRAKSEGLDNVVFHPPMPKRKLAVLTASLGCGLMTLDNIPAFYRGTSPNKFFDYIAAGIPVVNNYPGWLADMIEKNQFGLAVCPGSAELFADALVNLASNSAAAENMGKSARKFAEDNFDRGMLATKFVHTIESTVT